jgi:signal transduction histidine kinase
METGATLYTISSIAVISAILWHSAKSLNKADIERRMAEEALVATNAQLKQVNTTLQQVSELKTDILHIAAHDMKNPLGAIRTMAELVQSYPDDHETAQEMIGLIKSSANHMLILIEELLRTAALESGTIELNREYVDMSSLVTLVLDSNSPQAQRKAQQLVIQIEPRCTVEGDFSRLRESIDNLISNAVKYSPEGRNIYVTLAQSNGKALLQVRDEGQGLTEEDMKKLFGKFQRLHARPTGNESSTGLGLSIVKQLIELHHGRVWAESKGKDMGSTFYIELPLMERQQLLEESILE